MESERLHKNIASLEALLFIYGEPITLEKAARTLQIERNELEMAAKELQNSLASENRGLSLVFHGEKIQLATKPEFAKILEGFVKEELSEELTPASLETLSIISYFGPISRNRIEYLRGVNSSFILRSLLLRGLIERISDPDRPQGYVYESSFDLLKHLGLTRKENLPDYEKFHSLLTAFESSGEPPAVQ